MKRLRAKYVKLGSLTWLVSMVPLLAGVAVATEPLHGLSAMIMTINSMTDYSAAELIQLGLLGIGVRGALD